MTAPLEIEYKYLIRFPDIDILKKQPSYKKEAMCQMYLLLPYENGQRNIRCRIRKVENGENTRYIKTFKETVTDLTRIETETEIDKEEYDKLTLFRNPDTFPIVKERHSFSLSGFVYEVDVFPFWQDRAYLEVEVSSEEITPPIPEFIDVIRDISHDKRFRNSALAANIILEPIE